MSPPAGNFFHYTASDKIVKHLFLKDQRWISAKISPASFRGSKIRRPRTGIKRAAFGGNDIRSVPVHRGTKPLPGKLLPACRFTGDPDDAGIGGRGMWLSGGTMESPGHVCRGHVTGRAPGSHGPVCNYHKICANSGKRACHRRIC